MGHDVNIISNHSLAITSVEVLADDLARRLDRIVVWGYQDLWIKPLPSTSGSNSAITYMGDGDFVTLGYSAPPSSTDEDVLLPLPTKPAPLLLFMDMFCEQIEQPATYGDTMSYSLREAGDWNINQDIMRYGFDPQTSWEWGRWWALAEAFSKGTYPDRFWEYLNDFRRRVLADISPMGGTEAMYVDDQGPSDALYWMADTQPWPQIVAHARETFGHRFLNVREWLETRGLPPRHPFEAEPPLAFLDDFADLR